MANTTNYGWTKPTVLGSSNVWGSLLNSVIDAIDSALFGVEATADAAMPKAGGTFTGEIEVLTQRYQISLLGNVSGTTNLDLDAANFFACTVTGSTTFAPTNVPASGKWCGFLLEITNGGINVNWPSGTTWPSGLTPASLTVSGVDIVSMWTRDGGTTWRAALVAEDVS